MGFLKIILSNFFVIGLLAVMVVVSVVSFSVIAWWVVFSL